MKEQQVTLVRLNFNLKVVLTLVVILHEAVEELDANSVLVMLWACTTLHTYLKMLNKSSLIL